MISNRWIKIYKFQSQRNRNKFIKINNARYGLELIEISCYFNLDFPNGSLGVTLRTITWHHISLIKRWTVLDEKDAVKRNESWPKRYIGSIWTPWVSRPRRSRGELAQMRLFEPCLKVGVTDIPDPLVPGRARVLISTGAPRASTLCSLGLKEKKRPKEKCLSLS